jgi:carbamoyl-phosphate synthase large subunit
MTLILNNLNGKKNAKNIGAYDDGVYMMKYNELLIKAGK